MNRKLPGGNIPKAATLNILLTDENELVQLNLKVCDVPDLPSVVLQNGISQKMAQFALSIEDVPFYIDANLIEEIFVKIIELETPPFLHVFLDETDILRRRYFAISEARKDFQILLSRVASMEKVALEAGEVGGSEHFCIQYKKRFEKNPIKLKETVTEWLRLFSITEEKEKKAKLLVQKRKGTAEGNDEDDGDWQVVTCNPKKRKGMAFTHDNQQRSMGYDKRRSEKKRMMNFYRQHLNSKRNRQLDELKEKFERDKLIVSKMKNENRKFNPLDIGK